MLSPASSASLKSEPLSPSPPSSRAPSIDSSPPPPSSSSSSSHPPSPSSSDYSSEFGGSQSAAAAAAATTNLAFEASLSPPYSPPEMKVLSS